jgi:hypothetical protein
MGRIGLEIADMVGPPGKKSKPYGKSSSDDAEEAGESDDEEAAEVSAMEEFQSAVKDGSPEDALKAYKQLRDTCG